MTYSMCCQRPSRRRRLPTFVLPETAPTSHSERRTRRPSVSGSKTVSASTVTITGSAPARGRCSARPPSRVGLASSRTRGSCELADDVAGRVDRAVVDDDHLELVVVAGGQRAHGALDPELLVVRRHRQRRGTRAQPVRGQIPRADARARRRRPDPQPHHDGEVVRRPGNAARPARENDDGAATLGSPDRGGGVRADCGQHRPAAGVPRLGVSGSSSPTNWSTVPGCAGSTRNGLRTPGSSSSASSTRSRWWPRWKPRCVRWAPRRWMSWSRSAAPPRRPGALGGRSDGGGPRSRGQPTPASRRGGGLRGCAGQRPVAAQHLGGQRIPAPNARPDHRPASRGTVRDRRDPAHRRGQLLFRPGRRGVRRAVGRACR